jgi:formylglycine-generating enzyme required for sulfatase activity
MSRFIAVTLILSALLGLSCGDEEVTVPDAEPLEASDTVFISLPGGTFTNSRGEIVEIEPFQMLKTEVNNRLYRYLADKQGLAHPADPEFPGMADFFYNYPDHPVVNVSPVRAKKAASALGCSLPTRDQWEYAASIGLTGDISGKFPWGSLSPPDVPGVPANYMALDLWDQRGLDGFLYTAPCGSYPLSSGGFADLAGNVAEMTTSAEDSTIYLMGGSWTQTEEAMKFGFNRTLQEGDICWYAGFRLVK